MQPEADSPRIALAEGSRPAILCDTGVNPRGSLSRAPRPYPRGFLMSDYDRDAKSRYGAGLARSGVAVDQGLRAYMIGVYNYMTLGLGVTGLVAWGAFQLGTVQTEAGRLALTDFGRAIYTSPLRWVIVLAPLGVVVYLFARLH